MIFFFHFEAGETQFAYVVPFAIAELGHKCLEPAATLTYEPYSSAFESWRYLNVMLLNTFSRNKDDKIVKNQNGGLKVPLFDL